MMYVECQHWSLMTHTHTCGNWVCLLTCLLTLHVGKDFTLTGVPSLVLLSDRRSGTMTVTTLSPLHGFPMVPIEERVKEPSSGVLFLFRLPVRYTSDECRFP